ncbi:hypothetical protein QM012_005186 [Aureobasidium pullulans]|uniref:Uncharacterized protein n=1 Tax=Aureobasidium pullulans TaxID=5580 RepID=A0ABR0T713_AURPU
MPMTWDAAADAKLFTVVMAVYDIKISGAQNDRIAKMMGDDVTPKAITHRLSKIKAQASSFSSSSTPSSSRKRNTPNTKTPTSSKTPSTSKENNGKILSATHTITTLMHDNGSDDSEDLDTPTKTSGVKKRKLNNKVPKIEDADERGFFPGMGGDEDEGEDNGDAIDFSVGYTGTASVKMEGKGKQGGVVDLTEDVDGGKGKQKEAAKVKEEVVDVASGHEDDDEMVV